MSNNPRENWNVIRTVTLQPRVEMYVNRGMPKTVRVVAENETTIYGFPSTWSINLDAALSPMEYSRAAWKEVHIS
jgi:hypothetical protein